MNWYDRSPEELEKTVLLDTGTKVSFKKHPPHGHWTIHYDHGEMTPSLTGFYTSYELAHRAFVAYLANKTIRKTAIKPVQGSHEER